MMITKIEQIIEGILEISPNFYDNPNGGHIYSCPFCKTSKEVKASEYVLMNDLKHTEFCIFTLAKNI